MTDIDKVSELLEQAEALPYGPSRMALCEEAVRLADECKDDRVAYDARMTMTEAAVFGGRPEKALVAFAWCVAKSDADPENFPESTALAGIWLTGVDILWSYKWITLNSPGFSQISRPQIETTLEDMKRRYEANGFSLRPYWMEKARTHYYMGDGQDAIDECTREFRDAKRDLYADCEACEMNFVVETYHWRDDYDGALSSAQPLVSGQKGCAEVPHVTLAGLVIPAFQAGDADNAERFFRRGYDMCKSNRDFTSEVAKYIDYVRMSGDATKALGMFEQHLGWAAESFAASERQRYFEAGWTLFEELAEDGVESVSMRIPRELSIPNDDGHIETASARDWFRNEVTEIVDAFDKRNGNTVVSERTLTERLATRSPSR